MLKIHRQTVRKNYCLIAYSWYDNVPGITIKACCDSENLWTLRLDGTNGNAVVNSAMMVDDIRTLSAPRRSEMKILGYSWPTKNQIFGGELWQQFFHAI
jgi:hypothetical protein